MLNLLVTIITWFPLVMGGEPTGYVHGYNAGYGYAVPSGASVEVHCEGEQMFVVVVEGQRVVLECK